MSRYILPALLACCAATCPASTTDANTADAGAIPDPARAWAFRDLAPLEEWLESQPGDAREDGEAGQNNRQHNGYDNGNDGRAAALRAQAWLARRDGESGRALELIGRAIDLAPGRPDLRVDRAAFRSDQIEAAGPFKSLRIARDVRRDLEHALSVAPAHEDALAALAAFHLRAPRIAGGDPQAAAELMRRLGELAPARLDFQEALLLAEQERFAEAVDRVDQALSQRHQPRPEWRVHMGDWLMLLEREDAALDAYRQALLTAPRHTGALFGLGRLAAESGLAIGAGVDALHRFLELSRWSDDPDPALAWWHLGRINADAGCVERAEIAFRRALELDPDWDPARRSLEDLSTAGASEARCDLRGDQPDERVGEHLHLQTGGAD